MTENDTPEFEHAFMEGLQSNALPEPDGKPAFISRDPIDVARYVTRRLVDVGIAQDFQPEIVKQRAIGCNTWLKKDQAPHGEAFVFDAAFSDENTLIEAKYFLINRQKLRPVMPPKEIIIPSQLTPGVFKQTAETIASDFDKGEMESILEMIKKAEQVFKGKPVNLDPYVCLALRHIDNPPFPDEYRPEDLESQTVSESERIARTGRQFMRAVQAGRIAFDDDSMKKSKKSEVFYMQKEIDNYTYLLKLHSPSNIDPRYISRIEAVRASGECDLFGDFDLDNPQPDEGALASDISGIAETIDRGIPLKSTVYDIEAGLAKYQADE
jgi:hypothetical protein